jgi:hypothetical protein
MSTVINHFTKSMLPGSWFGHQPAVACLPTRKKDVPIMEHIFRERMPYEEDIAQIPQA